MVATHIELYAVMNCLDTCQFLDQLDPLCVMAATIPSTGVYVVHVHDDSYYTQ